MAIPQFHTLFHPFLALLDREGPLHMDDVQTKLHASSGLSAVELSRRLPSGVHGVFENRIGWARTYLYKSGLIARVARATYRISDQGRGMLQAHPAAISMADMRKIPAMRDWEQASTHPSSERGVLRHENGATNQAAPRDPSDLQDSMLEGERMLRGLIEADLRERLAAMSPTRFEWLVEQLVVKLGYGASDEELRAALSTGAGDGGVDGVIKEDRLGLGQIYLQAKRWGNTVGRPELQKFVGAMHGKAQKGVFITSGDFSRDAEEYARSLQGLKLRLIDGLELVSLMVDCGLGVTPDRTYRTWRIDIDTFEDAE